MEIIEMKYWWTNGQLFGAKSEWRRMYFSKEHFINLKENKGEKDNPYNPKEDHYILEYSYGDKAKRVQIDEKSASLLSDKLGFKLKGG